MTDIPPNALRARERYADGATTRVIMAETGLSRAALYHWIDGGPKKNGERLLQPLPKRKVATRRRLLKGERVMIVTRMMRAAEAQVAEIETRLVGTRQEPGERERDARTLAILARTIQSLALLDTRDDKPGRPKKKPRPDDDDDEDQIPDDIDALRRELSQKMAGMDG